MSFLKLVTSILLIWNYGKIYVNIANVLKTCPKLTIKVDSLIALNTLSILIKCLYFFAKSVSRLKYASFILWLVDAFGKSLKFKVRKFLISWAMFSLQYYWCAAVSLSHNHNHHNVVHNILQLQFQLKIHQ